jgi:hypothetical protein
LVDKYHTNAHKKLEFLKCYGQCGHLKHYGVLNPAKGQIKYFINIHRIPTEA